MVFKEWLMFEKRWVDSQVVLVCWCFELPVGGIQCQFIYFSDHMDMLELRE